MRRLIAVICYSFAASFLVHSLRASEASAACDTTGTDTAWGDFWIERSSTCECLFYMRQYSCVPLTGTTVRSEGAPVEVSGTKLTPGDCTKPCEAMSGYWSSVATVRSKQSSEYGCDTTIVDGDGDGYPSCIDQTYSGGVWVSTDNDPRRWVKTSAIAERACDSVDNDNDGSTDEGITGCTGVRDHKRVARFENYQGDATSRVNLVEGSVQYTTTDISVEGPFAPLNLTRYYDSRRELDECGLGKGWTHNFCVLLRQMTTDDDDNRYQVQKANGDTDYFRCFTANTNDLTCVSDDHRNTGGWLRRVGSGSGAVFTYYVGDGSYYAWQDNSDYASKRLYYRYFDEGGNIISEINSKSSERPQKIQSANSSIYLYFTYGTYGLDAVRLSNTSSQQALDFDVLDASGNAYLDVVKFAPTLGTIDSTYKIDYDYDATSRNLLTVKQNIDGTYTDRTIAAFSYDANDHAAALQDARKDLSISWDSAYAYADVTYNVATGNTPTVRFTNNGMFVTSRNADIHLGGTPGKSQEYDDHARITCSRTDDNRTIMPDYSSSVRPVAMKFYNADAGASCTSPGTLNRMVWVAWEFGGTKSWRVDTIREKSAFNAAGSCSTMSTGCLETNYNYVSSSDDRISSITVTGNTKEIDDDVIQQTHITQYYYYPDATNCPSGGVYDGLTCRVDETDGTNTLGKTEYYYVASGSATSGLFKSTKRYKSSGTSFTATFADATYTHNLFGSPTRVVDEAGVATDYAYNGWNAKTSVTENDGLLTDALPPGTQDRSWAYSYNKLRSIDTVTLPKGNKTVYKYFTASTGEYARTKAYANADSSGNLLEIKRFEYDKLGHRTEEKVIDSIPNSNDEDSSSWEVRRQSKFNARGELLNTYLHAADTTDPADATSTYTYTNGFLTNYENYLGMDTATTYDGDGRVSTVEGDDGGISATTTYTYDVHGKVLTTTGPNGVVTRTERDDAGRLVLERSQTRGDLRYEYNAVGHKTKRLESSYNSTSNATTTCYTNDWFGRQLTVDYTTGVASSCNGVDASFYYDGDSLPGSSCPTGTVQTGRLSTYTQGGAANMTKVLCYHPNGMLYSAHQRDSSTWSNTAAKGTSRIYDLNGNIVKEYLHDRPDGHTYAREVEYVYDSTLKDRVSYVRTKLTSSGTWNYVTSNSTLPTYFPFGGFKTLTYGNSVVETNTRDKAYRLTRKQATYSSTTYSDINLTRDVGSNVTLYDDSTGVRHLKYYTAYDKLNHLRCVSRASISSCSGTEPWEDKFTESFDFDSSGNRTNRRFGAYNTDDDDAYTYVASSDIIDKVTSAGTDKQMSNDFRGGITQVNQPERVDHTFDLEGRLATTNDNFLGSVSHYYTPFRDRFKKVSVCNSRKSFYYYTPNAAGGTSHQPNVLNLFNDCANEYPRQLRSYLYLDGRPIAVAHSTIDSSSSDAQTDGSMYWIETDQLGTPILVSDSSRTEKWRWENDPFGRSAPIEYGVSSADVNPDDSTGSPYDTCCCTGCGGACGTCTSGCSAGQCTGGSSQAVVWTKTYTPSGATNVRVHFSQFNVTNGTSRMSKDYLRLYKSDGSTVIATLTGNLGAHWSSWSSDTGMVAKLTSDYSADQASGQVVIDSLEYTTNTGRFIMHLRMPGQIYDEDALASYNWNRWYRAEDGRYLSPDPIGLAGMEPGYFAFAGSSPITGADATGLRHGQRIPEPETMRSRTREQFIGPFPNCRGIADCGSETSCTDAIRLDRGALGSGVLAVAIGNVVGDNDMGNPIGNDCVNFRQIWEAYAAECIPNLDWLDNAALDLSDFYAAFTSRPEAIPEELFVALCLCYDWVHDLIFNLDEWNQSWDFFPSPDSCDDPRYGSGNAPHGSTRPHGREYHQN